MAIFLIILIDESQRPYLLGPMKRDSREFSLLYRWMSHLSLECPRQDVRKNANVEH